jgi:hypothetical protein
MKCLLTLAIQDTGITKTTAGKFIRINMEKFKRWVRIHSTEIAWFIIGWLVTSGIRDLLMGNIIGALISFGFAFLNYTFSK